MRLSGRGFCLLAFYRAVEVFSSVERPVLLVRHRERHHEIVALRARIHGLRATFVKPRHCARRNNCSSVIPRNVERIIIQSTIIILPCC